MIFDGNLDAARAAGLRWQARQDVRAAMGAKLAAGGIATVETPERINARINRLTAVAADAAAVATDPAATTTSVIASFGQERMLGQSDLLSVSFLEVAIAVARYTGRISIRNAPDRTVGFGTGFMVSRRLLLTNHHVLPDKASARFSEIEFDLQNDAAGRPMPVVPFGLMPDAFFMTDAALDFTIVAVADTSASGAKASDYGWSQLIGAQGKVLIGENVNIVQHPKGEPKQIVLRSNELVDVLDTFLHYVADTEPGSSGSPVYSDQWDLVALHHSGVPRMEDGKQIKKDGMPFVDGDDPNDLDWVANEGVRISSIVKFVTAQTLPPSEARLRDEMLADTPPSPIALAREVAEAAARRLSPEPVAPVASVPLALPAAGTMTWTIPLTITVSLGAPAADSAAIPPVVSATVAAPPAAAPAAAAAQSIAAAAQPIAAAAPPAVPPPAAPPSPAKAAALAEAGRAAARTYYDATRDRAVSKAYYGDLATPIDALDPAAAFAALSTLVRDTHAQKLAYRPAVELYPWVDLQERTPPALTSIYSGKGFTPAELIEADFAIEAARVARASALPTESADVLEASLPFNCEHVVCQSWFGKREPMRGDLHHLFACEPNCNSFRGNTPYFDFPDYEEALRGDCGKREDSRFEPAAGKGAVARATLYFLLRYPGEIDPAIGLTAARLPVILDWHARNPVTRWEKHRNVAIQAKQGNRNPLIDFPAWGTKVDFARGFVRAA